MRTINIAVGPSRSGKSTFGKLFVEREDSRWIVVSRDKIREQLYSFEEKDVEWYWKHEKLAEREKQVTRVVKNNIKFLLSEGYNIYYDATNLTAERINEIIDAFPECIITFTVMYNAVKSECIERDLKTNRIVGKEVIEQQFNQFSQILKTFDFSVRLPRVQPLVQDYSKLGVFVFDIDKTLADNGDRPVFTDDDDLIYQDVVIEPVKKILDRLYPEQVIFVSGRSDKYRAITEKWLEDKVFPCAIDLRMRKEGDYRKDTIVKEEIFKELLEDYHIIAAFDDRNSVTSHLRKLGIFVFHCNQSEKEY